MKPFPEQYYDAFVLWEGKQWVHAGDELYSRFIEAVNAVTALDDKAKDIVILFNRTGEKPTDLTADAKDLIARWAIQDHLHTPASEFPDFPSYCEEVGLTIWRDTETYDPSEHTYPNSSPVGAYA